MKEIIEIYEKKILIKNDINEHLPVLFEYAKQSDIIIELGVRSVVSSWAFLSGKPKKLISVDIVHPKSYIGHDPDGCKIDLLEELAKKNEIEFKFILSDSVVADIPECDLIFFDTLHTYNQLSKELIAHGNKSKKFLIFHDTETFGNSGEEKGEEGISRAINEFLSINTHWAIKERFTNNNGLLILERINK